MCSSYYCIMYNHIVSLLYHIVFYILYYNNMCIGTFTFTGRSFVGNNLLHLSWDIVIPIEQVHTSKANPYR